MDDTDFWFCYSGNGGDEFRILNDDHDDHDDRDVRDENHGENHDDPNHGVRGVHDDHDRDDHDDHGGNRGESHGVPIHGDHPSILMEHECDCENKSK